MEKVSVPEPFSCNLSSLSSPAISISVFLCITPSTIACHCSPLQQHIFMDLSIFSESTFSPHSFSQAHSRNYPITYPYHSTEGALTHITSDIHIVKAKSQFCVILGTLSAEFDTTDHSSSCITFFLLTPWCHTLLILILLYWALPRRCFCWIFPCSVSNL